ncbi:CG40191 [Drosophila busckii]|uniref:Protein CNPPD1 n=1 Tax=Drosophila busckii TaxID=30019 RepID=A0A0M5IX11_DROBS|nr:CG40191 [Drosophila busckii]
MGRRGMCVTATPKKVMQHGEFIDRIRKTLYYGGVDTTEAEMGTAISMPFAEYAADLFSEPHRGHSLHRLSSIAAGKTQATPCSLIMALIYLDRLNIIDPGYGCRITPQELFVVSLMISTKFYTGHDEAFYLEDWAKEGNMSEDKLKQMELEFMTAIDWNIYISNEQFFNKLNTVERTLALREGLRRGWLTYSELVQLLPSFTLMRFLLNNLTVLAISYAASVFTIAGAFFIASQVPGTIWHRRVDTTATVTTQSNSLATPMVTTNKTLAVPVLETDVTATKNESCMALNVEEELLKLEQQFCAEARLNELQSRQRLEPLTQHNKNYRKTSTYAHKDNTKHWLNMKAEFSDASDKRNALIFGHKQHNWEPAQKKHNWNQTQNTSVFWQLITDAMSQPSLLVRWPELWPKLI